MTTVAFCAVSPGGRTPPGKPIWMRPTAVAGFRQLTDAVHAEGAAASVQIGHAGALANARENNAPAMSPIRLFNPTGMNFPKRQPGTTSGTSLPLTPTRPCSPSSQALMRSKFIWATTISRALSSAAGQSATR